MAVSSSCTGDIIGSDGNFFPHLGYDTQFPFVNYTLKQIGINALHAFYSGRWPGQCY